MLPTGTAQCETGTPRNHRVNHPLSEKEERGKRLQMASNPAPMAGIPTIPAVSQASTILNSPPPVLLTQIPARAPKFTDIYIPLYLEYDVILHIGTIYHSDYLAFRIDFFLENSRTMSAHLNNTT